MKPMKPSLHMFRRLLSDKRGSALPIVGLGLFTLLGATGIAIDMGRVQIVQSRLSSSLDAAGLAAGATANTQDVSTTATKYFNVNFPSNYMGSTLNSFSASLNGTGSLVILDAQANVPTTFMRLFGTNYVDVSAHTEITRSNQGMELVLVMDNTGSMSQTAGGSTTKIQAAKNATQSLLNILYGATNNTIPNLWVGVVPFSQAVNIGNTRSNWTPSTAFNWGPTSWSGCVEARGGSNRDVTDDPPSVELFNKYYAICDADTDGTGPDTASNPWYGTNPSKTNCGNTNILYNTPLSGTRGPNIGCPQPLIAMVAEKDTVMNSVNAMVASGSTVIPVGMSWGWRMLSPRWRGQWGGQMNTNNLPLDYNAPLMHKVVILMTDGDNDITWDAYSAYGYPNSGQLGGTNACSGTNCTTGETTLVNRTQQICAAMKAQGIIIYTVGLGTSLSATSQNLLRNCATSPSYYFASPTTAQLQTAFAQIGDSLANLRISK